MKSAVPVFRHEATLNILNTYKCMSKTLTVSEEAYERLLSRKESGESFSEVIKKITGKTTLLDIVGILPGKDAEALEKNITRRRASMRQRMRKVSKGL